VTGEWKKLHSEELHNVYSSPDIIRHIKSRRMRWKRTENFTGFLVGKPEGQRPLGGPSSRWEDGIRMDLMEIG
jgi:hypothetical protein